MDFRKVLITGGTSGLGLALVKLFLAAGCKVATTGRNKVLLPQFPGEMQFFSVNFSDLTQVGAVTKKILETNEKFDVIINNAGVLSPPSHITTRNGFEYTFQVNFLSHLLLDELIIREKSNADPLTVVSVTSPVYKYVKPGFKVTDKNGYRSFKSYAESKLYILMIGEYLRNKYPGKNLRFIGFDPGTFSSGVYRMQKKWFQNMYRIAAPFMRRPEKVAKTLAQIIRDNEIMDGAIYSKQGKFRYLQSIDTGKKSVFWKECNNCIEQFI